MGRIRGNPADGRRYVSMSLRKAWWHYYIKAL